MTSTKRNRPVLNEESTEVEQTDNDSTSKQFKLGLSQETLLSALDALLKDALGKEKQRLQKVSDGEVADDDVSVSDINVFLQLTWKVPPLQDMLRPKAIPLKHPLKNENDEVIFFVKDPQRQMKDYLARHGSGGVTRVLGVEKLRKRYKTHEGRRELLRQYDRFLVDARVAPMMVRLLGKAFVNGKHMPLSVDMNHDIPAAIQRTLDSTAFCPRRGTSCSILVARADFPIEHVVENVSAVLDYIIPKRRGGWKTIQSINIKTSKSPALPIYLSLPTVSKSAPKPSSKKVVTKAKATQGKKKYVAGPGIGKRKAETELEKGETSAKKQRKQRSDAKQTSYNSPSEKNVSEHAKEVNILNLESTEIESSGTKKVQQQEEVSIRKKTNDLSRGMLTPSNRATKDAEAPKELESTSKKRTRSTPVSGKKQGSGKENVPKISQSKPTGSTKLRTKRPRRTSS